MMVYVKFDVHINKGADLNKTDCPQLFKLLVLLQASTDFDETWTQWTLEWCAIRGVPELTFRGHLRSLTENASPPTVINQCWPHLLYTVWSLSTVVPNCGLFSDLMSTVIQGSVWVSELWRWSEGFFSCKLIAMDHLEIWS